MMPIFYTNTCILHVLVIIALYTIYSSRLEAQARQNLRIETPADKLKEDSGVDATKRQSDG